LYHSSRRLVSRGLTAQKGGHEIGTGQFDILSYLMKHDKLSEARAKAVLHDDGCGPPSIDPCLWKESMESLEALRIASIFFQIQPYKHELMHSKYILCESPSIPQPKTEDNNDDETLLAMLRGAEVACRPRITRDTSRSYWPSPT
jgi:hypothetical protein